MRSHTPHHVDVHLRIAYPFGSNQEQTLVRVRVRVRVRVQKKLLDGGDKKRTKTTIARGWKVSRPVYSYSGVTDL